MLQYIASPYSYYNEYSMNGLLGVFFVIKPGFKVGDNLKDWKKHYADSLWL